MKIAQGIEVIPGSPNTLIVDDTFVVDLGGKNSELGIKAEYFLATHGHADHIAGLLKDGKKFLPKEDLWGLTDIGRRMMVYGFSSRYNEIFTYDLIRGDIITELGNSPVETLRTPGHTPGHVIFLFDKVVYLGDTVLGEKVLENFVFPFHADVWAELESLEKVKEVVKSKEYSVIAHGPIITNSRKMIELIEKNITYLRNLEKKVISLISDKPLTAEQIVIKVMQERGRIPTSTSVLMNSIFVKSLLSGLNAEAFILDDGLYWKLKGS
ncbi:hypothetical protein HS7_05000 [Sulfolobales archaeon HS-7]|nr:hypothetical protein HS7_05000 [Sulfolobales archaeon HS-7]